MDNKKFGLISSVIFSSIVSTFTPKTNPVESLMLFCLLFIAYCKFMEKD